MKTNRWTKNDVQALKQLAEAGLKPKAIAVELGRTRRAVMHKAARHGIKFVGIVSPKPFSIEETEELTRLFSMKQTLEQIAVALDRPTGSIRAKAKALGLHVPSKRPVKAKGKKPVDVEAHIAEVFTAMKRGYDGQPYNRESAV